MLEAVWQGVVELGHGAVQAVQRDGWQQQQRRSGGGGGEEQEKLRSRADAGRTAIRASRCARQKFSMTARALKRTFTGLKHSHSAKVEDNHWNITKRHNCSGTNWPNSKVGRH